MSVLGLAAGLALFTAQPVESQNLSVPAGPSFADLADLSLQAPFVAHVRIADVDRLGRREAANVPPGNSRFLVVADVAALIRGPEGTPRRISYLIDLPNDARGRPARLRKKEEKLIMAANVAGARPGEVRLVAPDAQLPYSPDLADQLRRLLREAAAPQAPPRITGIGRAFHVRGTLAGESETQIFLQTAEQRPISLSILRRPGEQVRWAISLTEIVDDAAAEPQPNSLLWYRLACSLPTNLPNLSLAEADTFERQAIVADYGFVRGRLGPCIRRRSQG